MDWIFCLLYSLYSWFANLGWWCRRNVQYCYLVGPDGRQHALNTANLKLFEHLLVIYYTPAGTRYRFHPIDKSYGACSVAYLKSAYVSFAEPKKYKLFAVNATVHERVHTINAIEFNVVGNVIFSPVFNLWLCYNYLHISPSVHIDVSYIDDSTEIQITKGPITFYDDLLLIKGPDAEPGPEPNFDSIHGVKTDTDTETEENMLKVD